MDCLDTFSKASSLSMNLSKRKLFTSPGVSIGMSILLSRKSGIPRTDDLGVYLGAPTIHGRITKSTHLHIVERMERKLTAWKRNTLTMVGRRTLIQSVTSSMPVYTMQSVLLPMTTCEHIDRVNRNFLWGSDLDKKKMHHVKWTTVCLRKDRGGLGIRNARDINLALVAKLGWRLLRDDPAPW